MVKNNIPNNVVDIIEEDYMSQGVTSPKELVLRHLDRLSLYIFKGDVSPAKRESNEGMVLAQMDRRIITMQAIDFLVALLKPYYDKQMTSFQSKFSEAVNKIEENLLISSIHSEALNRSKGDEEGFEKWVNFFQSRSIIPIDKNSSSYELSTIERYSIYLKLFEQLNYLLKRKNYLEGETFGE